MRGRVSAAFGRFAAIGACAVLCLLLANCSNSSRIDPRYGVSASPRVVADGEPVPKGGGVYRVGAPLCRRRPHLRSGREPALSGRRLASWYGDDFHGRLTANGEVFDLNASRRRIRPCRCRAMRG